MKNILKKVIDLIGELRIDKVIPDDGDTRIAIKPTNLLPWEAVCQLTIYYKGGLANGTGWLLNSTTLVTAGHCIFSEEFGHVEGEVDYRWADYVEIYLPEKNALTPSFASETVHRDQDGFRVSDKWKSDQNSNFDYGVLRLKTQLLNSANWLEPVVKSDLKEDIYISGYPEDKEPGKQYHATGKVKTVTPNQIQHFVDTNTGDSGAPVLIKVGEKYQVVGIHSGPAPNPSDNYNVAVLINDEVLKWLNQWKQETA